MSANSQTGTIFLKTLVLGALWWTGARPAHADAHYNWDQLLNVRRVAIVAPYFCTGPETAQRPAASAHVAASAKPPQATVDRQAASKLSQKSKQKELMPVRVPEKSPPPPSASPTSSSTAPSEEAFYTDALKSLTATMQTALPGSLAKSTRYTWIKPQVTAQALRALRWEARDLFLKRGALTGQKFPSPDPARLKTLAKKLNVDAVLIGTMRDPASIGDGVKLNHELWNANLFNLGLKRVHAHVLSPRVQAFLVTASGVTAWQDEQMADRPRTKTQTLQTLLLDWQEATEQVAQQLADSLLRQPPG